MVETTAETKPTVNTEKGPFVFKRLTQADIIAKQHAAVLE
jgi:hypothetical protein